MRGLCPGRPRNGFRMEKETSFSNLQHRFSCQEILDSKKKNYNHKEKGFAVLHKKAWALWSQMLIWNQNPETIGRKKEWRKDLSVGPDGTLLAQQELRETFG